MKTQTSSGWITSFLFLLAPIAVGLAQTEPVRELVSPPAEPAFLAPTATASVGEAEIATAGNYSGRGVASLAKTPLSPWAGEIVKLARAGIEDGVILSFIDNSGTFNLSAEQIIHLSQQGVSSEIITAMLQHDADVISGVRPLTISSEPAREPLFQISFSPPSAGAQKLASRVESALPPIAELNQPATPLDAESSLESNRLPGEAVSVEWQSPVSEAPRPIRLADFGPRRTDAHEGRGFYPVREPHPVPLTAPIIIMQVSGPTPNTMVISFSSPPAR